MTSLFLGPLWPKKIKFRLFSSSSISNEDTSDRCHVLFDCSLCGKLSQLQLGLLKPDDSMKLQSSVTTDYHHRRKDGNNLIQGSYEFFNKNHVKLIYSNTACTHFTWVKGFHKCVSPDWWWHFSINHIPKAGCRKLWFKSTLAHLLLLFTHSCFSQVWGHGTPW